MTDDLPPTRPTPIVASDLPPGLWSTAVPIRFGHCDPAGIVYTPHYFHLFNGVVEIWHQEALGLDYYALIRDRRIGLGYGHAACDFFAPSRMGEVLRVSVRLARVGTAAVTLILHAMHGDSERVRGRLVAVSTSLDTHAVLPLAPDLRRAYQRYQAHGLG